MRNDRSDRPDESAENAGVVWTVDRPPSLFDMKMRAVATHMYEHQYREHAAGRPGKWVHEEQAERFVWIADDQPNMMETEREMDNRTHRVKTHESLYEAIMLQAKKAEFRKNDRNYRHGDTLVMTFVDDDGRVPDGKEERPEFLVSHVVYGPDWGIPDGYCMMSITPAIRK